MHKQTIAVVAVVAFVAGGTAFFGGMKYASSKTVGPQGAMQDFRNLTPEQRQARLQQFGAGGGNRTGNRPGAAGMGGGTFGEILSKDDKSITVKLRDGGSRIIFFDQKVEISKFTSGNLADLAVGTSVSVNGASNADGSLTATMIQIRPAMPQRTTSTTMR